MFRRNSVQVSIEELLGQLGRLDEFTNALAENQKFRLRLEKPGFMPLVVEVLPYHYDGEPAVSVAHYYRQNGDSIADPEIVFRPFTYKVKVIWEAVELTQAFPPGAYRRKYSTRRNPDGTVDKMIDTRFESDIAGLLQLWGRNIRNQGWDTATIAQ